MDLLEFILLISMLFFILKTMKYKNIGLKRLSIVIAPVATFFSSFLFEQLNPFSYHGDDAFLLLSMLLISFPGIFLSIVDLIKFSYWWVKTGFAQNNTH